MLITVPFLIYHSSSSSNSNHPLYKPHQVRTHIHQQVLVSLLLTKVFINRVMETYPPLSLSYKLILLCMALLLPAPNQHFPITAEAAVTCSEVYSDLYPCVSYVISGGIIPTSCCNGLKTLNASANTTTDHQVVCRCIQSATSGVSFTSYSLKLATELPTRCGVRVPYQMSPTTNCDMIP